MKEITVSELPGLGAGVRAPFVLRLTSSAWHCSEVLRVLPGRRIVLRAVPIASSHDDEGDRILKLFIGRGHVRYRAREQRGLVWLLGADLPVPGISGSFDEPGLSGLEIEYLPGAAVIAPQDQTAVEAAAGLLGRMHDAGLWQVDLHLKNFVTTDRGLHAVDGDGVRRRADPVPHGRGLEDLALLAAQRPPSEDPGADGLVAAYAAARDIPPAATDEFARKLARARRGRLKRYLRKCFRECTEFSVTEREGFRCFADRAQGQAVLDTLLERGVFTRDADFLRMEAVKRGNSATLVRTNDPGVIIKRYNIKSLSQGFRRLIRPVPRYRRAWMCGQLLGFLDIPTAKPLALVEEKRRLLPGVAYLVQEDLGTRDLAAEIADSGCPDTLADEVAVLFAQLRRVGITHGDTKATNFLIHQDRVHLIDLDAMRLVPAERAGRGFGRDLERFLDNWDADTRAVFEAAFRRAGLT